MIGSGSVCGFSLNKEYVSTTSGWSKLSLEVEFPILSWCLVWLCNTSQPSLTPEISSEIQPQKPMTDYLGHFGRSLSNSKETHYIVKTVSGWKRVAGTWPCHRLDRTQKIPKANPRRFFCRLIGICMYEYLPYPFTFQQQQNRRTGCPGPNPHGMLRLPCLACCTKIKSVSYLFFHLPAIWFKVIQDNVVWRSKKENPKSSKSKTSGTNYRNKSWSIRYSGRKGSKRSLWNLGSKLFPIKKAKQLSSV